MADHDAWRWLHRAVRRESVPENMRSKYDAEEIYGPGSVNIRSMHAANDLWHSIHHHRSRVPAVRRAWMAALTEHSWWDREPYSRHRYGVWIWESQLLVWAAGVHLGDDRLRDAAAASLNTAHVLLALSAGWEAYTPGDRRQHGYRTTMTGARSWVAARPDGVRSYRDSQGNWYRPAELDFSPLDNVLWWIMGKGRATGERADVVESVLTIADPRKAPAIVGDHELFLTRLAAGPREKASHINAVRGLPELFSGRSLPKVPCIIVRSNKYVAFLVEESINPGSTHFRYGQVWSKWPVQFDGDYRPWDRDRRQAWLVADDVKRQNGESGRGELIFEDGGVRLRCQRLDGTTWHPVRGQQPGWSEVELSGEVYSAVRIGPDGVEILVGQGERPPGPEPRPRPDDEPPDEDDDRDIFDRIGDALSRLWHWLEARF